MPQNANPIHFDRTGFNNQRLVNIYRSLLYPRLVEERMLLLLRQGKIGKWFSGIGQEAIAVGVATALRSSDFILPLHRNLGVFTQRGMPLERLMAQWIGRTTGYTHGRDRSFHFGSLDNHVVGMVSHLGSMLSVACGLALAAQLDGTKDIAVAFSGDGASSEGDFHEALNLASVWDLPVIFLVENNGYALSSPTSLQTRCQSFADKAIGYGIEGCSIDGNNILQVITTFEKRAASMRTRPKPVLVEANTFRIRGHEEASGTAYVPKKLQHMWAAKDPINNFENFLHHEGVMSQEDTSHVRTTLESEILAAWKTATLAPKVMASPQKECADVFATPTHETQNAIVAPRKHHVHRTIRFIDAITEGLHQAMETHDNLVLMGQDIGTYGGVFKVTQGLIDAFGSARVRDTPLCESAIFGCALGLSMGGRPSVVEMQFADFISCGFNQVVNNIAKTHYRWGHPVNVTIRLPTGGDLGAGPFHSQCNEAWFAHVPGLKIVYPATPSDAKGLLVSAIDDPNPVMFFEHKKLYRSVEGHVPEQPYALPIGSAQTVRHGHTATLVTYGAGVHWAMDVVQKNPHFDIEIIDLRTLLPWDEETVFASVRRTGKCLILHEDTVFAGLGAEYAAQIGTACFDYLDAPVMRLGALDTPVPFNGALEQQFLPKKRLHHGIEQLLAY